MVYGLRAGRELAQRTAADRQRLRAHLAEREAAEQERLEHVEDVNEFGDVRCPRDGERVNKRCWNCGWVRPTQAK